jgi:hypothetical protein
LAGEARKYLFSHLPPYTPAWAQNDSVSPFVGQKRTEFVGSVDRSNHYRDALGRI